MATWKNVIEQEWRRRKARARPDSFFPLIAQSFDHHEIIAAVEALLTGRLTMGEQVERFEKAFARRLAVPFAVMVNSGSSANLLALAVAANPERKVHLRPGDEVLVPAVCWPTSLWPVMQMGLKPVFVDVDPETLNLDPAHLRKKLTRKTRALMAVHILGNCAPMQDVLQIIRDRDLLLIEDTCESLGSQYAGRQLGTLGAFGCYSFYYSHHITTGEGGMVVCQSPEDYDLLRCLRAHGWSRSRSDRQQIERRHPGVDSRFLFVNLGYNLRPTEVAGAFGNYQLKRLARMNRTRTQNRQRLIAALQAHPRWREQFSFTTATPQSQPAWFGFACLLQRQHAARHKDYLRYLSARGVENRPIVSGNFVRQPAIKLLGLDFRPEDFPGAEEVHRRGFFIGLHTERMDESKVQKLAQFLLGYDFTK